MSTAMDAAFIIAAFGAQFIGYLLVAKAYASNPANLNADE